MTTSDLDGAGEWKLEALAQARSPRAHSLATTASSQYHFLPDVQELLDPHTDDIFNSMLYSTLAIDCGNENSYHPSPMHYNSATTPLDYTQASSLLSTLLSDNFAPPLSIGQPTTYYPTNHDWRHKQIDHRQPNNSTALFDPLSETSFYGYQNFVPAPATVDRLPAKQTDQQSNRSTVLADFRSGRLRLTSLFQIKAYIAEFARDQAGGRFIQQRLAEGGVAERQLARQQLMPTFRQLATDAVGNHVLQKLFETGTPKETYELFKALKGDIVRYTLHAYGCRVLQKALQAIPLSDAIAFADELRPHVIRCVEDQNGNHVIQKCVERLPFEHIQFILNAFKGQVARIAMHCYGCRVVQRILEHSPHCQISPFLEEIRANFMTLAQDQYGNYVIQHLLRFGQQTDREYILDMIVDNLLVLASHKFSSNVVERCMELKVAPDARRRILKAAFGPRNDPRPPIMSMIRDPYANYVVQRILDVNCTELGDELADDVLMRLEKHLPALRKFTYGKHIAAALERLRRQLQERSRRMSEVQAAG